MPMAPLQGVRGFNDPRAISLPNKNLVGCNPIKKAETYAPFRLDIHNTKATWMSSLPHSWVNQVDARNNGHYDKWLEAKHSGNKDYRFMPLTMGFHTREDIFLFIMPWPMPSPCATTTSAPPLPVPRPTACFSGAAPSGISRKQRTSHVWNEDADYNTMVSWATFPERLEENGISWKVYQNKDRVCIKLVFVKDNWLAANTTATLEYSTCWTIPFTQANLQLQQFSDRINDELQSCQNTNDYQRMRKIEKELDRTKKAI